MLLKKIKDRSIGFTRNGDHIILRYYRWSGLFNQLAQPKRTAYGHYYLRSPTYDRNYQR